MRGAGGVGFGVTGADTASGRALSEVIAVRGVAI